MPIESIPDFIGFCFSLYDVFRDPSLTNFAFLLWDLGALCLPYVPGSYVNDIGKASVDLIQSANRAQNVASSSVWSMKQFDRGWAIEKMFGGLCTNFETLDWYRVVGTTEKNINLIGNVVSIKSIDLNKKPFNRRVSSGANSFSM